MKQMKNPSFSTSEELNFQNSIIHHGILKDEFLIIIRRFGWEEFDVHLEWPNLSWDSEHALNAPMLQTLKFQYDQFMEDFRKHKNN